MIRPAICDYPEHYRGYVGLVPEGDIIAIINAQIEETVAYIKKNEDRRDFRYAEGKWSLIEVIGHMIDTERIQAYRLMRIARGDKTPLAGYDDEGYVENARFSTRTIEDLLEELVAVRKSTVSLLRGLSEDTWENRGFANNGEFTVLALAYIIAGHELHHLKLIKERYMV
ncbi:DinB family protein [Niallia circulans]|jgi:DinB superfamily|uniref:DinB family protein n=1 Tax=Niallia TaxID=2837506 RepID=UPI00031CCB42|nr:DinB family protein [Niallia circulans]AYV68331.1 DinB family protein [Niallia circulans]AYV73268.1 DinB family protein [Niallia circulans]NRG28267.1 DinB family protein [Niallia circulans]QJX64243.1 DinB family protein [Niallia circulans]